jgi:DNA-binding transcriptional MerR regulator
MTKELTLEDLATISGLSLRTLRFYMQEGLLQGPDTHGKNARYSQQHLDQLELIQRLKNLRLPLQEIHQLINNMTPEEVSQIRNYQDVFHSTMQQPELIVNDDAISSGAASSALDYIHGLEEDWHNILSMPNSPGKKRNMQPSPAPSISRVSNFISEPISSTQETWYKFITQSAW